MKNRRTWVNEFLEAVDKAERDIEKKLEELKILSKKDTISGLVSSLDVLEINFPFIKPPPLASKIFICQKVSFLFM
jgi:hypothetical protein